MRISSLSICLMLVVGCGPAQGPDPEDVEVADEALGGEWALTPLLAVVKGPLCAKGKCVADFSGASPRVVRSSSPPSDRDDLVVCSGTPESLSGCKSLPPLPGASCAHGNCLCTGSIDCATTLSSGNCVEGTEQCQGTGGTPGEGDVACSCVKE